MTETIPPIPLDARLARAKKYNNQPPKRRETPTRAEAEIIRQRIIETREQEAEAQKVQEQQSKIISEILQEENINFQRVFSLLESMKRRSPESKQLLDSFYQAQQETISALEKQIAKTTNYTEKMEFASLMQRVSRGQFAEAHDYLLSSAKYKKILEELRPESSREITETAELNIKKFIEAHDFLTVVDNLERIFKEKKQTEQKATEALEKLSPEEIEQLAEMEQKLKVGDLQLILMATENLDENQRKLLQAGLGDNLSENTWHELSETIVAGNQGDIKARDIWWNQAIDSSKGRLSTQKLEELFHMLSALSKADKTLDIDVANKLGQIREAYSRIDETERQEAEQLVARSDVLGLEAIIQNRKLNREYAPLKKQVLDEIDKVYANEKARKNMIMEYDRYLRRLVKAIDSDQYEFFMMGQKERMQGRRRLPTEKADTRKEMAEVKNFFVTQEYKGDFDQWYKMLHKAYQLNKLGLIKEQRFNALKEDFFPLVDKSFSLPEQQEKIKRNIEKGRFDYDFTAIIEVESMKTA